LTDGDVITWKRDSLSSEELLDWLSRLQLDRSSALDGALDLYFRSPLTACKIIDCLADAQCTLNPRQLSVCGDLTRENKMMEALIRLDANGGLEGVNFYVRFSLFSFKEFTLASPPACEVASKCFRDV
jgi:hypothetical protein